MDTYIPPGKPSFCWQVHFIDLCGWNQFWADLFHSAYELYLYSKLQQAEAGVNLKNFFTSSDELCNWTSLSGQSLEQNNGSGGQILSQGHALFVLGVMRQRECIEFWESSETLIWMDVSNVKTLETCMITCRIQISLRGVWWARMPDFWSSWYYVTVRNISTFFQQLCEEKLERDEQLTWSLHL